MLSSVDEVLAHAGIYDPAARRKRYLETRHLKGRAPGQQTSPTGNSAGGSGSVPTPPVTQTNAAASNARQVAVLQGRLSTLKAALQKLLADAGSSSASKSSSSSKSGGAKTGGATTAKEKADARKASDKYRKENPAKVKADAKKAEPTKEEKIAHLRAQIADVESKLRAALENART